MATTNVLKKKSEKKIQFTTASKTLGINLTIAVEDLYNKILKTTKKLQKELEDRKDSCTCVRVAIYPTQSEGQCNPYQNSHAIVHKNSKIIFKFTKAQKTVDRSSYHR